MKRREFIIFIVGAVVLLATAGDTRLAAQQQRPATFAGNKVPPACTTCNLRVAVAGVSVHPSNVRCWGISGHRRDLSQCLLMTQSGHPCKRGGALFVWGIRFICVVAE